MMRVLAGLFAVGLMLASGTAEAATVTWKGLTWDIKGANTTAVVNGSGGLDITVLGGQSGDPSPDNWVLYSPLPANLTQANAPWVEFKFKDTYAGDKSVGAPRGFVDTYQNNKETMWQGGVIAGYSKYYLNHHVWDYGINDWVAGDWYVGPVRSAGEHTVKFGMLANGDVDMWFDGVLGRTISASPDCTFFEQMYLGVSAQPGVTVTGTYNDLRWGTGYTSPAPVPEPLTMAGLMLGIGSLVTYVRKRRKA